MTISEKKIYPRTNDTQTVYLKNVIDHEKTKSNKWWKEKIRQTLQYNPSCFINTSKGMWQLRKKTA